MKPTRSKIQAHEEVASLAEQWWVPLDGPRASSELLDWLVQEGFSGNKDYKGAMPRRFSGSQPTSSSEQARRPDSVERAGTSLRRDSRGQLSSTSEQGHSVHLVEKADTSPKSVSPDQQSFSQEEPDFSQPSWRPDGSSESYGGRVGWHGEPLSSNNDLETEAASTVTAQEVTSFHAPESGAGAHAGYDEGETEPSTPVVSPTVAPPLPLLLYPQRTGLQPLPRAAETARQDAREEGPPATDDLDELATKIKQILDEQARRHGIDV